MNFDLAEEHRMLADLVGRFVDDELMPLEGQVMAAEAAGGALALPDDERRRIDDGLAGAGALGPGRAGGCRRRRPAAGRVGGGERAPRPHRDALHPAAGLAQPAHADGDRHAPPARGLPRPLRARRDRLGDRHLRARRRRRSGGHDHPRDARWRGLGDQRPQDLDHPRRRRRLHHPDGGDRPGEGRARRHFRLPGRQGHARIQCAAPHSRCSAASSPTRSRSRIAASRVGSCSASKARASRRCRSGLGTRRLEMAAWSIGMAGRALSMMCEFAPTRVTFGEPLSRRGVVQGWIAEAATHIHAARLMTYDCAWKLDQGPRRPPGDLDDQGLRHRNGLDRRRPRHAVLRRHGHDQGAAAAAHGRQLRTMRIYDGPTEIHHWVVARNLLGERR